MMILKSPFFSQVFSKVFKIYDLILSEINSNRLIHYNNVIWAKLTFLGMIQVYTDTRPKINVYKFREKSFKLLNKMSINKNIISPYQKVINFYL